MTNKEREEIESIEHDGIVETIDPTAGTITVRISDLSDCGSCPATKLCKAAGADTNIVTIPTPDVSKFNKDDEVVVEGTEKMHHTAVMLATVIPCIVLVAVMVLVYLITFNQLAAALSGLGCTFLFYLLLYLCRNKIAHEFVMTVRRK